MRIRDRITRLFKRSAPAERVVDEWTPFGGFVDWVRVPPPFDATVECCRREWGNAVRVLRVDKLHPATNVGGLYWRIAPSRETIDYDKTRVGGLYQQTRISS